MTMPGHEFLSKLEAAEAEIRAQNEKMASLQKNLQEENREDISSQIDMAVGSGSLILKGKCKQFRELCQKNINEASKENAPDGFPTTKDDLEGFWDMLSLPLQKVMEGFAAIERLKENGWIEAAVVTDGKKIQHKSAQLKKKPLASKNDSPAENNNSAANKHKEEARKRLMEFKKAAKDRLQNQSS